MYDNTYVCQMWKNWLKEKEEEEEEEKKKEEENDSQLQYN